MARKSRGCVVDGSEPILRPGEVALRMNRKPGQTWEQALDDVFARARTGEMLPGDIVGTAYGEVRIPDAPKRRESNVERTLRGLKLEGLID